MILLPISVGIILLSIVLMVLGTLKIGPKMIQKFNFKKMLIGIGIGLIGLFINSALFYSQAGNQYFVVGPLGTKSAVVTEGYKFIMPLSKITPWQKYIDVKVPTAGMNEDAISEIEGIMQPIPIRFIDQVTANSYVSIRFQLPQDAESFIALAIKFRSMTNLINNTLIPTVNEQMVNTGYMYSAQNYISGDAQSFKQTFEEQLKFGAYAVKKIEIHDTLYNSIDSNRISRARGVKEIKTRYIVEKVLVNGVPKRIQHEITENNIIVSQVIVDAVDLEGAFKVRLEKQRDESAKRQLEQQKIKTAKDSKERIIAEGERDKAKERVAKEQEAISILVAEQTILEKEKTKLEQSRIKYEKSVIDAKTVKVNADAKQYELAHADGLSEEVEFLEKQKTRRTEVMAKAIENAKWPTTVINGGTSSKGNNGLLSTLIGANLATKMVPEKK